MPVISDKKTKVIKPSEMKDGQIGRIHNCRHHGGAHARIGWVVERKGDNLNCLGRANNTTWIDGCRENSNAEPKNLDIEILPNSTTIRIVENE